MLITDRIRLCNHPLILKRLAQQLYIPVACCPRMLLSVVKWPTIHGLLLLQVFALGLRGLTLLWVVHQVVKKKLQVVTYLLYCPLILQELPHQILSLLSDHTILTYTPSFLPHFALSMPPSFETTHELPSFIRLLFVFHYCHPLQFLSHYRPTVFLIILQRACIY